MGKGAEKQKMMIKGQKGHLRKDKDGWDCVARRRPREAVAEAQAHWQGQHCGREAPRLRELPSASLLQACQASRSPDTVLFHAQGVVRPLRKWAEPSR